MSPEMLGGGSKPEIKSIDGEVIPKKHAVIDGTPIEYFDPAAVERAGLEWFRTWMQWSKEHPGKEGLGTQIAADGFVAHGHAAQALKSVEEALRLIEEYSKALSKMNVFTRTVNRVAGNNSATGILQRGIDDELERARGGLREAEQRFAELAAIAVQVEEDHS